MNADDFGQSEGVNDGVRRSHEDGVVTSASLMVRWPAASDAAAYARSTPALSVGLHLDLGEWEYLGGEWRARYEVVPTDNADTDSGTDVVRAELGRQLDRFEALVGRPPTHLDSHQHVHRAVPIRRLLAQAGRRLGIPVRDVSPGVAYCGDFYGQDGNGEPLPDRITVEALVRVIGSLPAGVTELGCHPATTDDVEGAYRAERLQEVEALCDPRVRAALAASRVALRSFASVRSFAS
ncbi:MAG: carbohydrate deacetylase [Acidimicrobiales bacterium]